MSRNVKNIGRGRGCFQKDKQKKNEEIYNKNPRTCNYCNSAIPYKKKINKFCNHSCSCSYNNQGVIRNKNSTLKNKCVKCGELTRNIKYCSQICRVQDLIDIIIREIKATGVLPTYQSGEISIGARRFLIDKRGRKCEECKNNTWMGFPIPIEFHHKNGNPDDNKEKNIQILCSNCHSLTRNHRGKNRNGNGRWSKKNINRRKRYAQGLST